MPAGRRRADLAAFLLTSWRQSSSPMSTLLICGGFFVTICGSIFAYDVCRAPEGFEDETGFRSGDSAFERSDDKI
jgi:hypothetical protein